MRFYTSFVFIAVTGTLFSCSAPEAGRAQLGSSSADGSGGAGAGPGGPGGPGSGDPGFIPECKPGDVSPGCAEEGAPGICGDGILTSDEACDDGNTVDGDGCVANCLSIEVGHSCVNPGELCRQIARCGDGLRLFPELCDDGNKDPGDGCSATCKVEIGFKCDDGPCVPTTCGDGVQEGAESCDDGNTQPFDGCSVSCQTEPNCTGDSCTSVCGDGLVLGEECDDGNLIDGDGCSATCTVDTGFECSQDANCEKINDECVLRVSAIYRDFDESHPDFEPNCSALVLGVVEPEMVNGRPKLAEPPKACITSGATFDEWYTDTAKSQTIVDSIVLFDNGQGGFVNRYGELGEKWVSYEMQDYTCAADCVPCSTNPAQTCTQGTVVEWDGHPLFFPLDGEGGNEVRYPAKVPEQYGWNGWPFETALFPNAPMHNFYFTTEVKYWFKFEADTNATLAFTGDDDVWVFVNGILAADIGGPHVPETANVVINAASAATYKLEAGKAYQVSVFHAERKQEGSSFQLTLDGFNSSRSECRPVCGDGIVGLGEECDDGVNDGGYGECAAECVLGPHCGDGIVQPPEDCDDGNNVDDATCPSACRKLSVPK